MCVMQVMLTIVSAHTLYHIMCGAHSMHFAYAHSLPITQVQYTNINYPTMSQAQAVSSHADVLARMSNRHMRRIRAAPKTPAASFQLHLPTIYGLAESASRSSNGAQ